MNMEKECQMKLLKVLTIKVLKRVSYSCSDFYHLRNRIMYIFNDNEIPLPIPLDLKKINYVKKTYYNPRKKYESSREILIFLSHATTSCCSAMGGSIYKFK